jgi:DNA-binding beta-propeller fold protein YncE
MIFNNRLTGKSPLIWLFCVVLLVLAGCAAVEDNTTKQKSIQIVWPLPPDPPRFYYEFAVIGSGSIEPITEEESLKEMLLGNSGRINEGFGKPYAVTVNKGRMYVSDTVSRVVRVFDAPLGTYFKIGSSAEENPQAQLMKPMGLDTDAAGNLYVVDATLKVVKVYTRDGKYLRSLMTPGDIDKPASVTVDQNGERIYVVDIGGVTSNNHRVRVYDAKNGKHLFDIGTRGDGPGEFNLPRDTAIGKNGQIYVVDSGNFRIQVFDHEGKYLRSFGQIGKQLGNFGRPKEIAADKDGNVYVIDAAFGNFQIFNPEGELLMFIGQRSNESLPGNYLLPSGITVDEDGRVYVVDQWFKKIEVFRPVTLAPQTGYFVRKRLKK